jgi:formylmethanofuran--tetrahydromethanopterin N-formyltransferase
MLELNGVAIVDTFAEAFPMTGTRLVITADSMFWAHTAATEATGYAASVISCDVEAGVEGKVPASETPDGRAGVSILMFGFGREGLEKAVTNRVGQCVLTCATTACFDGLPDAPKDKRILVGGGLRFFGDGFQQSKKIGGRRYWRVPVMDGEFLCEDKVGTVKGVGGGNLILFAIDGRTGLAAARQAAKAMNDVPGVILPFPGGVVRSGSKVGSRYAALKASTNDAYCPTLRSVTTTEVPEDCQACYELVVDGLTYEAVQQAMKAGLQAACQCEGVRLITAGNYGGKLGPHHFHLRDLLNGA